MVAEISASRAAAAKPPCVTTRTKIDMLVSLSIFHTYSCGCSNDTRLFHGAHATQSAHFGPAASCNHFGALHVLEPQLQSIAPELTRLASVPLLYAPGTAGGYSLGLDVLGEIMSRATRASLPALVEELMTIPLAWRTQNSRRVICIVLRRRMWMARLPGA